MAHYTIKAEDTVQFDTAVVLKGSFDKNAIAYTCKVSGKMTGQELRGILEHASSLKVRMRAIKDKIPTTITFGLLLGSLGESNSTSAREEIAALQERVAQMEAKLAEQGK